ncbi:MAG: hypothetical protein EOP24_43635 [Hyphomicrobiales bacterium]|nr:MAG: hypothetical protein EOP24_43635 [Hyphomicrobiales bacterium]
MNIDERDSIADRIQFIGGTALTATNTISTTIPVASFPLLTATNSNASTSPTPATTPSPSSTLGSRTNTVVATIPVKVAGRPAAVTATDST